MRLIASGMSRFHIVTWTPGVGARHGPPVRAALEKVYQDSGVERALSLSFPSSLFDSST